jgi:hypothetical protein
LKNKHLKNKILPPFQSAKLMHEVQNDCTNSKINENSKKQSEVKVKSKCSQSAIEIALKTNNRLKVKKVQ